MAAPRRENDPTRTIKTHQDTMNALGRATFDKREKSGDLLGPVWSDVSSSDVYAKTAQGNYFKNNVRKVSPKK